MIPRAGDNASYLADDGSTRSMRVLSLYRELGVNYVRGVREGNRSVVVYLSQITHVERVAPVATHKLVDGARVLGHYASFRAAEAARFTNDPFNKNRKLEIVALAK